MHKDEMRLIMDVAIGKAPPLTEDQLQHRLREEAHVSAVPALCITSQIPTKCSTPGAYRRT